MTNSANQWAVIHRVTRGDRHYGRILARKQGWCRYPLVITTEWSESLAQTIRRNPTRPEALLFSEPSALNPLDLPILKKKVTFAAHLSPYRRIQGRFTVGPSLQLPTWPCFRKEIKLNQSTTVAGAQKPDRPFVRRVSQNVENVFLWNLRQRIAICDRILADSSTESEELKNPKNTIPNFTVQHSSHPTGGRCLPDRRRHQGSI